MSVERKLSEMRDADRKAYCMIGEVVLAYTRMELEMQNFVENFSKSDGFQDLDLESTNISRVDDLKDAVKKVIRRLYEMGFCISFPMYDSKLASVGLKEGPEPFLEQSIQKFALLIKEVKEQRKQIVHKGFRAYVLNENAELMRTFDGEASGIIDAEFVDRFVWNTNWVGMFMSQWLWVRSADLKREEVQD